MKRLQNRENYCPGMDGPFRIAEVRDPDEIVKKQFIPEEGAIQVHQLRAYPCLHLPI